jgi:nicotinate-nucleotide adenylyltransferase
MHIGLYFGSFNPIHTGHLIIAAHVLGHTPVDKVWFVVSPHNPLKESSHLLNEYDRLNLVQLAIDDHPGLRASNVEFSLPRPSFTVDTLAYLSEKFPHEQFTLIMGSDSFSNISRWKNYELILKYHDIVVYNRPGFPVTPPEGARVQVLQAPMLEISATYIREEIRAGRDIRFLVPGAVADCIRANRYYL